MKFNHCAFSLPTKYGVALDTIAAASRKSRGQVAKEIIQMWLNASEEQRQAFFKADEIKAKSPRWSADIERTIEIAKTKWVKDED
jgi:hypothetical protein